MSFVTTLATPIESNSCTGYIGTLRILETGEHRSLQEGEYDLRAGRGCPRIMAFSYNDCVCHSCLAGEATLFRDFPWPVVCFKWHPILLLPLRCGLHFHQDLIECGTIKEPAVGNYNVDFLGVPNVVERVGAQQH